MAIRKVFANHQQDAPFVTMTTIQILVKKKKQNAYFVINNIRQLIKYAPNLIDKNKLRKRW